MDIQKSIGADIIMAFDECTPYPCDYSYAKDSMEMTHHWLIISNSKFNSSPFKYDYSQHFFQLFKAVPIQILGRKAQK